MASDTFLSKNYGKVYVGDAHSEKRSKACKIGEAGIYAGMAIRVAADIMYLAKDSDKVWSGIAADMPGIDIDDAFTYSATAKLCDKVEYYGRGTGLEVVTFYSASSPAVNLVDGDILVLSSTDGLWSKFAYTDGTDITDSPGITGLPVVLEDITGSVSYNKLVKVRI